VGLLAEGFTVLAVLEARDKASEIYEKCGAVMKKFGGDVAETADTVKGAADEIDESLATTASGVDPLELAAAKVSAAEDKMAASTQALVEAQQRLVAVSGNVAPLDAQGAAAEDVAVAQQRAAEAATEQTAALAAQREALLAAAADSEAASAAAGLYADAQGRLRDAQGQFVSAADAQQVAQDAVNESATAGSAALTALAEANERVAAAEKLTADAAAEASAAQARQDALVTSDDVAAAAGKLTTAEKGAASASKDLSAAQQQQAAAQKAVALSSDEAKAAALAQSAADKEAAENSKALSGAVGGVGKVAGITAIGMGVLGAVAVKAAGNFQSLTAHLVTDAGESASNLAMIRAGILSISSATGTSATDITNAMYHIESAGIHGAAGLAVAKVAAEGAKVGGADLDTVSKTLVGTLNSYGMTSKNSATQTQYATSMMNMLIATVGSGDMRMQDLASSLGSVTPLASAAGLSFSQVGGAVATMTSQNMTAQRATTDLDNLLRNIVKPSKVASTEMRYLGISANQVSTSLKGQGLTGVMDEYTQAIMKNSSQGMVTLGFYKQMTPATKAWAQGILAGKVTTLDLTNAMKGMTPQQAQIITQFKAAAVSATGLKQTYTGALATLTGGATGLNTSLMLTGKNASAFAGNVAKIAAEGRKAGASVDNWSTIQGTFNQKVDVAKTAVENTGIAIGSALLPAVATLFSVIGKIVVPVAEWTAKHKTLTEILFVGVTALAATVAVLVLVGKTFKAVSSVIDEVKKA
jgi:TP901 family phage tail tape measure protein